MHLWKTLAALGAVGLTAAIMPTATASKPKLPTAPTKGACAFTPMTDQTYSTFVGLPPDPTKPTTHGKAKITLKTNRGDIPLVLNRSAAPCAVRSMIFLAHKKYFDGTKCHRLTAYHTSPSALSVLQCGDPLGTGWGDPGYWFKDEFKGVNALPNWPGFPDGSRKNYTRGTLAMANGGPNTNGSQFFLVYEDSRLSPDYTVFGHITPVGMRVLDRVAAGGIDPGTDGTPEDGTPALTTIIQRAKSGA